MNGVAESHPNSSALRGLILGTAIGDSLCLPYEGMTAARSERRLGRLGLRHSLVAGRGMLSDDTEHTSMVARAFLTSRGDPAEFERAFARLLRNWFLCLPPGIGLGTARACLKLCVGANPSNSGVRSAGNGPAMRAGILGLLARSDDSLRDLVARCTRVTHTDPRAIEGAWIVAACAGIAGGTPHDERIAAIFDLVLPNIQCEELRTGLESAVGVGMGQHDARQVATLLGCTRGVSGYVCHTVPVAIAVWLQHPQDFRGAMQAVISLGGDTDTVGAIAGGLVGAGTGEEGIPGEWLDGLADWPISTAWLRALADATERGTAAPPLFWPAVPVRNILLLLIVLAHGFRRLIPERSI